MGGNQLLVNIKGMRGRVTDSIETGQFGQATNQSTQTPLSAVWTLTVIGIDVLAQEGDLARPAAHKLARLGQDLPNRTRIFCPPGIRHDAKAAEFVTAFLHRQKSRWAAPECDFREEVEFRFNRKLCIENPGRSRPQRTVDQLGQTVVALRAEHEIDTGRTAYDLRPLGLRDATGHRYDHVAAALGFRRFQAADRAEFGVPLFGRLFPDVTRIEDYQIRLARRLHHKIPIWLEEVGHPCRVINVHLAAIGLDIDAL